MFGPLNPMMQVVNLYWTVSCTRARSFSRSSRHSCSYSSALGVPASFLCRPGPCAR